MKNNAAQWTCLQAIGAVILLVVILTALFIRAVPLQSVHQIGQNEILSAGSFRWTLINCVFALIDFAFVCGVLVLSAAFLYQAMFAEGGMNDVVAVVGIPCVLLLIYWIVGGTTGVPSAIPWTSGTGAILACIGLAGTRRHQDSG